MSLIEEEDFVVRRDKLAAQIARQRTQLASAYQDLEKPIRYTEYGMKGFGFLRQNPWIVAAAPAIFSLVSSALGWRKKKPAPAQSQSSSISPTAGKKISRLGQAALTGVEQALRVYNLYRRVRSLIP